jgi:hypothetical protein
MVFFYRKAASFCLRRDHLLKLAAGDFKIYAVPAFYNSSLLQDICEVARSYLGEVMGNHNSSLVPTLAFDRFKNKNTGCRI